MRRKQQYLFLQDLCSRYIPRLRTFVELNFSNLRDETDDTVQSILEKIVHNYSRYDSRYSINTWIYSMARNYCIDQLRKQKRRSQHYTGPEQLDRIPDPSSSPEMQMERKWVNQRLHALFMTLSDEERQVLFLSLYEELKLAEIAEVMKKPLGTVKTMKYRAMERIKAQWEDINV